MKTMKSLFLLLTLLPIIHGFSIHSSSPHRRHSSTLASQQPNFGDWTNDDYLDNLGNNSNEYNDQNYEQGYNNNEENNYNQYNNNNNEQQQPQNEMTDEEITQWALNAASFYNTETSVQEAYGIKRDGPPRRPEGTDVDGW